jgi:hypothetical protein
MVQREVAWRHQDSRIESYVYFAVRMRSLQAYSRKPKDWRDKSEIGVEGGLSLAEKAWVH